MQKLKSIFAIFTLLAFLFPTVEKGIHEFSHSSDVHCNSADKHFHASEHHCEICDFTIDFDGLSPHYSPCLLLSKQGDLEFFFTKNNLLLQEKHFYSLRAPPSLV